jgi:hypothetical protein
LGVTSVNKGHLIKRAQTVPIGIPTVFEDNVQRQHLYHFNLMKWCVEWEWKSSIVIEEIAAYQKPGPPYYNFWVLSREFATQISGFKNRRAEKNLSLENILRPKYVILFPAAMPRCVQGGCVLFNISHFYTDTTFAGEGLQKLFSAHGLWTMGNHSCVTPVLTMVPDFCRLTRKTTPFLSPMTISKRLWPPPQRNL